MTLTAYIKRKKHIHRERERERKREGGAEKYSPHIKIVIIKRSTTQ
jgi:hypothetical protein